MVKLEKFGHLHLVSHFTVPLMAKVVNIFCKSFILDVWLGFECASAFPGPQKRVKDPQKNRNCEKPVRPLHTVISLYISTCSTLPIKTLDSKAKCKTKCVQSKNKDNSSEYRSAV